MKNFKEVPSILGEINHKKHLKDLEESRQIELEKQFNYHNFKKYVFLLILFLYFIFLLIVANVG